MRRWIVFAAAIAMIVPTLSAAEAKDKPGKWQDKRFKEQEKRWKADQKFYEKERDRTRKAWDDRRKAEEKYWKERQKWERDWRYNGVPPYRYDDGFVPPAYYWPPPNQW